jgi:predicted hydrocarbon binding protein
LGFKEALDKTAKEKKIRKKMSDNVSLKYSRLLTTSLQWVSVGYSSALYFAGKKLGKEVLAKEVDGKDLKSSLNGIIKLFKEYGIGLLEIKEMEKNVSVVLKDSVSGYKLDKIGRPVCFFECGLIAGILEAKLNKNVTVTEVLCGGLGDDVDEFLIKM